MFFKVAHLKGIKRGEISLAFRKWKTQSVKKGTLLKTAIGQIEILDIEEIKPLEITDELAIKAGFQSSKELTEVLSKRKEGQIYKIEISFHSEDPRISLRNKSKLSTQEFDIIRSKLQRLDQYSKQGPWTEKVLNLIKNNPHKRAADLATIYGSEKDKFKLNVRKLKNMGLTISHDVGYSISPLGETYLELLK